MMAANILIGVRSLSKKDGYPEIIPIPGATTVARVQENANATILTSEDVAAIDSILKEFEVAGDRYDSHGLSQTHESL